MPFLIYKRQPGAEAVRFEFLQSLKLGGANGPIARHVKTLKGEAAEAGWELAPPDLAQLVGVAPNGDELAVLFEVPTGEPNAVCLYRLHQLCGVARDRKTHLSLDFEVLVDGAVSMSSAEFKNVFTIPVTHSGRRLREVLQLSGGPDGGDWKWEAPAMNLGATLVGPQTPART